MGDNKMCKCIDLKGAEVINNPDRPYNIIIQKQYGSWTTVSKSKSHIIDDLLIGITLDEFKHKYSSDLDLLKTLFSSGVLRTNGQLLIKDHYCPLKKWTIKS